MNRRGFLKGLLAAPLAPVALRAAPLAAPALASGGLIDWPFSLHHYAGAGFDQGSAFAYELFDGNVGIGRAATPAVQFDAAEFIDFQRTIMDKVSASIRTSAALLHKEQASLGSAEGAGALEGDLPGAPPALSIADESAGRGLAAVLAPQAPQDLAHLQLLRQPIGGHDAGPPALPAREVEVPAVQVAQHVPHRDGAALPLGDVEGHGPIMPQPPGVEQEENTGLQLGNTGPELGNTTPGVASGGSLSPSALASGVPTDHAAGGDGCA